MLVVQQVNIDGFRATRIIQDKAQSEGNGWPLSRAVTPYWMIRVAPFGRVVKRSSAVLRLLARTSHYRRDAPCGQPLHHSLNPSILTCWTTSHKDDRDTTDADRTKHGAIIWRLMVQFAAGSLYITVLAGLPIQQCSRFEMTTRIF
jgi:hypothetical protein